VASGPAAADLLRRSERELTRRASSDLAALWRQVRSFAEAGALLQDVLPALIDRYGTAAATLAAEWYDQARAEQGFRGTFHAIPFDLSASSANAAGAASLAGWATGHGTSLPTILELAQGGMSRRIMNASRRTVMGSAIADPRAAGWQRTGTGECDFCAMLIGRGDVYTEATADFAAHDSCHCGATVAWRGAPVPVKPYVVSPRRTIDPDTGKPVIDADYVRAREWIDSHS